MKSNQPTLITDNSILRILIGTACILSIPLIAMQFTSEVDWDLFDFIVMGSLLSGTGLIYEFIVKNVRNTSHRTILALGLLFALLLIWAELAVGIFGTPFAGS